MLLLITRCIAKNLYFIAFFAIFYAIFLYFVNLPILVKYGKIKVVYARKQYTPYLFLLTLVPFFLRSFTYY